MKSLLHEFYDNSQELNQSGATPEAVTLHSQRIYLPIIYSSVPTAFC